MKIQRTITIEIEDAKFHFRACSQKEMSEFTEAAKGGGAEAVQFIFARLERVENLTDEADNPVNTDELRELNLPFVLAQKVARLYWDKLRELIGDKGADAKNAQ